MTTNTKTTATTNVSFHRVMNQIAQKFSLDSAEKKQIADFIKPRAKGEIKVAFAERLPDGNFVHYECQRGDMGIMIAHSSDMNPDTFYVVTREIIKEEDKKAVLRNLDPLSATDRDSIMVGTIRKIKQHLKGVLNLDADDLAETKIYNFLTVQLIAGRIGVVFTPELPTSEELAKTKIQVGEYDLHLVYGVNPRENDFVHVLWVKVKRSEEIKQRKLIEKRKEQFRKFWENNKLPSALLEEVVGKVNFDEPIEIAVYAFVKDWSRHRKAETKPVAFIGQTPDPYTGNFIPDKPIGYVCENRVLLTSPGTTFKLVCHEFK